MPVGKIVHIKLHYGVRPVKAFEKSLDCNYRKVLGRLSADDFKRPGDDSLGRIRELNPDIADDARATCGAI